MVTESFRQTLSQWRRAGRSMLSWAFWSPLPSQGQGSHVPPVPSPWRKSLPGWSFSPRPPSGVKPSASTAELQDQVQPAASLSLSFPTCRPTATANETLVPGHSPGYSSVLTWLRVAHATHVHIQLVHSHVYLQKAWVSCSLRGPRQRATHRKCSEQSPARISTH